MTTPERPAWSDQFDRGRLRTTPLPSRPIECDRDWAWGGARGAGVRVGIIDSGIEAEHPALGGRVTHHARFWLEDGEVRSSFEPHDDCFGHGTACAGILHRLAPEAEIVSIRVLGPGLRGKGEVFAHALDWAIDEGIDIVNLSLGSTLKEMAAPFHDLADRAYFRDVLLVTAANNRPVDSYPSLFSSVVSVACHEGTDPFEFYASLSPPPEFGAPGIDLEVPWIGGGTLSVTGNSFAAPHIAGLAALIRSKHGRMRSFEIKSILRATATNARQIEGGDSGGEGGGGEAGGGGAGTPETPPG